LFAVVTASVPVRAEERVALVVGNAAYQHTAWLANPANDADDMTVALRKVGFEVIAVKDVDKRSLERAMANLGAGLKRRMLHSSTTLAMVFSIKALIT
jgi:hypothetical protein